MCIRDSDSSTTIDVGYLNVAWWKPVQFRMGIFKMPMNLEELTSSNNIDFMERSFVNGLAPGKEIGAMIHGSPFKGTTYALAFSNGNGKTRETDLREDGKDIIGRVTANFAEIMDNKEMVLHAGASFSQGDQYLGSGATAVGFGSARTEGRGATFMTGPSPVSYTHLALPYTPNESGHASVLATFVLPPTNIIEINPNMELDSLELAARNGYPNPSIPGIGSALVPIPLKPSEFYMMTDRGVNFDYVNSAGKVNGKVFPMPKFTPAIVHVKLEQDKIVRCV